MGLKYPLKKFHSQWPFQMAIRNQLNTIFGKECHIWNTALLSFPINPYTSGVYPLLDTYDDIFVNKKEMDLLPKFSKQIRCQYLMLIHLKDVSQCWYKGSQQTVSIFYKSQIVMSLI